jgi:NAD(P)-dependent dehydrogenase (short-subunit alcohol dehydrogenase family)
MKVKDAVVVITGAANGIGYALARRFKAEGARGIALADIDGDRVTTVSKEIGALGFACDVSREQDIQRVVRETERAFGPIDLFCSMPESALPIRT